MKSPRLPLVCCLILAAAAAHAQAPAGQPARPGQLPTLPLTQLDDRTLAADLDNRTFTLTFGQPVLVRDLLLMLVRGTVLSIVPDPSISGSFIGELKNVTVRQSLELILPPFGLDYAVDGSFVRVFRRAPETRIFDINYLALERAATITVGGADAAGSSGRIVSATGPANDVFADIAKGVQTLLSDSAAFNVDRKAGLLQVTDFPERLERVSLYLDTVHDRVHRQVQIDARVIEVELTDPAAASLDWDALANGVGARAAGGVVRPMLSGLRAGDVPGFLAALAEQGTLSVLATPRLLALNNEPAIVRAAMRMPGARPEDEASEDGIIIGVTPQISSDGVIMLGLSPVVTVQDRDADGRGPDRRSTRETDTVARVADGETIVIAGFARDRETRERRTGRSGGWFGRSTVTIRKRVELVILLTPKIVGPLGTQ